MISLSSLILLICFTLGKAGKIPSDIPVSGMIETTTKSTGGVDDSSHLDLSSLSWFALDDGVMGGKSSTKHGETNEAGALEFSGTINTNGGGFCSVRAELPSNLPPPNSTGLRIKFNGDGKTYKLTMSDGSHRYDTLSWQYDIPTTEDEDLQVLEILYSDLIPAMGPRKAPSGIIFDKDSIKELSFMLSLKLSNGQANPVSTFGEGVFPFELEIHSVEFIE